MLTYPIAFFKSGIVSTVSWQLPFYLNLLSTVGSNASAGGTSVTYVEEWSLAAGLLISSTAVPAGVPASRGQRKSTDTDEGGSVAAPVFLNTVSKVDSTKLHPSKLGGLSEPVFLLYDFRENSTAYTTGDKIYTIGTDSHNYSLTCTSDGTSAGSAPAVVTADIGTTDFTDGTAEFSVDHYYSNIADGTAGGNYLPHVLSELAATNACAAARAFSGTGWIIAGAININKDAVGVDGVANSAATVTDTDVVTASNTRQVVTIDNDSATHSVVTRVGKTVGAPSAYLALQFYVSGGTLKLEQPVINTTTGTITAYGGSQNEGTSVVESFNADFWEVTQTIANNNSGNTELNLACKPAINTDGSGTQDVTATGSAVFDWVDIRLNSATVDSPIFTNGGTVTRDATSFPVTPDTAEYLRIRFADIISQTYMASGTVEVSYDSATTTVTVTDGTNAMTHIVSMVVGDWIVVKESTGELWYNGSLVDTNGSYAPTWGEIELGNAVDYRFDADLDPTDLTWSQP